MYSQFRTTEFDLTRSWSNYYGLRGERFRPSFIADVTGYSNNLYAVLMTKQPHWPRAPDVGG
jgi:hypothetical protein